MEPMEIAKALETEFGGDVIAVQEFRDQVTVTVSRESIVPICRWLRDDPGTAMNFLSDLCVPVMESGKTMQKFNIRVICQTYNIHIDLIRF